jgi:methionyl-tRNA synthetase
LNPSYLRYFYAAKLSRVEDIEFTPDEFVAKVSTDLVNKVVTPAIGRQFVESAAVAQIPR